MKRAFFIFIAVVAITAWLVGCKKEKSSPYQINFVNNTGTTISEAVVNTVSLGDIASGGQTGYTGLDEFYEANGMAECAFTGKQGGESIESDRFVFCCSIQPLPLRPGKYDVYISVKTVGGKQYFELKFK